MFFISTIQVMLRVCDAPSYLCYTSNAPVPTSHSRPSSPGCFVYVVRCSRLACRRHSCLPLMSRRKNVHKMPYARRDHPGDHAYHVQSSTVPINPFDVLKSHFFTRCSVYICRKCVFFFLYRAACETGGGVDRQGYPIPSQLTHFV